ncbi:amidohydrolase [bacterium]|nr:amidohydrolase [bacterium]
MRIFWLVFLLPVFASAQDIPFDQYDPPSSLIVPGHIVTHAKFPFIDVHNHQFDLSKETYALLAKQMDSLNMKIMVNLSGRGFKRETLKDGTFKFGLQDGAYLKNGIDNAKAVMPGRMILFTNVDFYGVDDPDWTERTLKQLEADVKNGAQGLKVYKNLGFNVIDGSGKRLPVDDPRLDPIWKRCGELGIPVLIHTGEPRQFWQPKDKNNERLEEMKIHPERYRDPATNPSWEKLMQEQHNMFRKHPETTFIMAHMGWLANDLASLGKLMDSLPNMYTEIGAILAELGRQPKFAREWFIKYQDRVMFGKDSWEPSEYHTYFRVLESDDEYFDYYRHYHAFWKMYGMKLPDDVLKKLYYKNALKVIPGIDKTLFPD